VKPTSRNLTPFLAALVLLSLVVAAVAPVLPVSASQEADAAPSLHRLHLLYDKATGRQVDDPTARASGAAADEAEARALLARKIQEVDAARITFRSGITIIHPEPGMEPGVREALAAPAGAASGKLWLIQFRYPFPTEARSRLEEAGAAFYDYLDVAAFFARVPPGAAPLLEELLEEGLVRYVGSIPAGAKVDRALVVQATRQPTTEKEIVVLTFDEPSPAQLQELGRWMSVERWSVGPIHIVEGRAPGASILALARLETVRWVAERSEATLGNLDGGMGVGGDVVRAAGFDGTGVQVMVVDSGIARQGDTYHPDLQGDRILDQHDYQAIPQDDDATDNSIPGHGTHVAGTIGGRYNATSPNSNRSHQGMAPDADFLIYRLFGPDSSFSYTWFQEALLRATSGGRTAHVSNNSWGEKESNGDYWITSEIADRAVRGEYNSRPVNVVAAAMNDSELVRSPGTGKNVITVGAVKDGNYLNIAFTYACGDGEVNWPPGERVCYSNHGPVETDSVPDGQTRVKPDLMAPGAIIISPVPWYMYTPTRYYTTMHGTSMATPHVTGAIAQLLDAYSDVGGGWLFNWPEMVKAMLLATAVDIGENTDLYGHGLLDAYHAITAQAGVDEPMDLWAGSVSTTGEIQEFSFDVPPGYDEVRLVLTWADPPGATEAINNLDIDWVRDGSGVTRGSATSLDDNVEYVRISTAGYTPGTWRIRVRATSVTSSQPFALAAHVILADAALTIRGTPSSVPGGGPSLVPGGELYFHQYVTNSGYTAGGSYARLHVPEGFTVLGVTVYTQDGHEHWYAAGELYHDAINAPDDWFVAVGDTLAGFGRHVRWTIDIDEGTDCGGYPFENTAYWRQAGTEQQSTIVTTHVPVACHFTYLPLVMKGY
jgi:subtilisin family serine protease